MRAVIILYFCVAITPSIIHCDDKLREKLEEMANINGCIDDIFQPTRDGYLDRGAFGLSFKGTLLKPFEREVAMKFTPLKNGVMADREYEAYTYLNAINNDDVERYGIPAVYYYGKWDDYIMMAITLLDSDYTERRSKRKLKNIDILILAREFVAISKYIHSHGVHHNDVKLDNLMFRKHQAFFIDFNTATQLYRKNSIRKLGIPPEDVFEDRRHCALEDWSAFLNAVCIYIGVNFNWFNKRALCKLRNEDSSQFSNLKNDIAHKIDQFDTEEFRQAFIIMFLFKHKLAECYQNATRFQLYDELYRIICAEIEKLQISKPVLVSWLTDEDKEKAKAEFQNKQFPDISTIKDRFANIHVEYPRVNFNYFTELNREKKIRAVPVDIKSEPDVEFPGTTAKIYENFFSKTLRWIGF